METSEIARDLSLLERLYESNLLIKIYLVTAGDHCCLLPWTSHLFLKLLPSQDIEEQGSRLCGKENRSRVLPEKLRVLQQK
jgi:hypothetical protein